MTHPIETVTHIIDAITISIMIFCLFISIRNIGRSSRAAKDMDELRQETREIRDAAERELATFRNQGQLYYKITRDEVLIMQSFTPDQAQAFMQDFSKLIESYKQE